MIDYDRLAQLIKVKSGLTLDRSRIPDIDAITYKLVSVAHVKDSDALFDMLETEDASHSLWQTFLRRVTIGETYFFRNATQYNALQTHILPALIKKRREKGFLYLNIWSAGCSTGEEPYSIAILLEEMIPDIQDWTINILGTDINQESLRIAAEGKYRRNSFRTETRPHVKGLYFTEDDGVFDLKDSVKRRVSFSTLNLISDDYPDFATRTMHQDIILCRNVTIYFNEADTRLVADRFFRALTGEGWLIVGHSEPSMVTYKAFEIKNLDDTVMYQKPQQTLPGFGQINPVADKVLKPKTPAKQASAIPLPRKKAVKKEAEPEKIEIKQIQVAVNQGDWDMALSLLSVLENKTPMDPQIHYLRGLVLMNSGSMDAARQSLRRSLYCDPTFALAHYAMGEVYSQQGNSTQAQRCWMLSDRAVAGLDDDAILADDLSVAMFRDLLLMRLDSSEEKSR